MLDDERVVVRCSRNEKKLYRAVARQQGRTMSGAVRYAMRLQAENLHLVKPPSADLVALEVKLS